MNCSQCYDTINCGVMFLSCLFVTQGNCPRLSSVSDKNNWKVVMKALSVVGFSEEEVQVSDSRHSHCYFYSYYAQMNPRGVLLLKVA